MTNYRNNEIVTDELPDFEAVELLPISKKYLKVLFFNIALFSIFIISVVIVLLLLMWPDLWQYSIWIITAVVVLLIINSFINYLSFYNMKYACRDQDLIYSYGIIQKNTVIVPYNRIQHSALREGWLSGMLGLKSVTVFTAGGSASDITINGLPQEVAERINQLIVNKIKQEHPIIDQANPEIPSTDI